MTPWRIAALTVLLGGFLVTLSGCGGDDDDEDEAKSLKVYLPNGKQATLRYLDLVEGTGPAVKNFDKVEVNYTGWLPGKREKPFDSSLKPGGQPFKVVVGEGKVIKGWDEGLIGMKAGGKRKLFIPSELGYGEQGAGKDIPPNSKLIFEIHLLRIMNKSALDD